MKESPVKHRVHTEGTVKVNRALLAPCGFYCGNCLMNKKEKCAGCEKLFEATAAKGEAPCGIRACAIGRGFDACAECGSYPCDKYDASQGAILSDSFVRWIRESCK